MNDGRSWHVYFDHRTAGGQPPLMGILSAHRSRGRELFSFELSPAWLEQRHDCILDPDLLLFSGPRYTEKENFGLFMDSAPDRWGRRLMQRREALIARREARQPRPLSESDYLIGVYDETRMGALRFKAKPDGPFLNDDTAVAAPPWARLRELEAAARNLEDNQAPADDHAKWLRILLAPGSSLGGARPKACVVAPDGSLWMAKFPAKNDDCDVAAWEYMTYLLAREAGLHLPEAQSTRLSPHGTTFLTRRFDRDGGRRIHFASAMTLLGMHDGADIRNGATYLGLAEFIQTHGADPEADLHELWTRIVFSIAVSNTDDHLRNHGFLYTDRGWRLSPAYDLNPNPQGLGLSLGITEEDCSLDFGLALQVAPAFRLKPAEAETRLTRIRATVSHWSETADRLGIPRAEQTLFAPAFRF